MPIAIAAAFTALLVARCMRPADVLPGEGDESAVTQEPAPPPPSSFARMTWPTPQTNLLDGQAETVFQATASGRIESAFYGSVRTANTGGRVHPSFHEGIDIAPVTRDRSGRALDAIFAVADGRVAYLNRKSGGSNYGIYLVLFHDDPIGEVYTLYAHLAEISRTLSVGQHVETGTVLGRMGNTPSNIVPVQRSHLHFEVGLMVNARFDAWFAAQKTPNPHGRHHGWNLLGCDPLAFFAAQRREGTAFSMLKHMEGIPAAFEVVIPARRLPDFFVRYPRLWQGGEYRGPALVTTCTENGIPLRGRPATEEEATRVAGGRPAVLHVDPEALGRNGRRIVAQRGEEWVLGSQAANWIEILVF